MAPRPKHLDDAIARAMREQYPHPTPTLEDRIREAVARDSAPHRPSAAPASDHFRHALGAAAKREKVSQAEKWNRRFGEILRELGCVVRASSKELAPGADEWAPEFRYNPERQHRYDWANPTRRILVDIQGATFGRQVECHRCGVKVVRRLKSGRVQPVREGGGHSTGGGVANDADKLNNATILGFRVIIFTDRHMRDGSAIATMRRVLGVPLSIESPAAAPAA